MKTTKIIYWITTVLFSLVILMGVGQYFFNTEFAREAFMSLGYPASLVIPLGIAKLLGVIAILSNKNLFLAEWAYAGFFYVLLLAIAAHAMTGIPSVWPPFAVLVLLAISYFTDRRS